MVTGLVPGLEHARAGSRDLQNLRWIVAVECREPDIDTEQSLLTGARDAVFLDGVADDQALGADLLQDSAERLAGGVVDVGAAVGARPHRRVFAAQGGRKRAQACPAEKALRLAVESVEAIVDVSRQDAAVREQAVADERDGQVLGEHERLRRAGRKRGGSTALVVGCRRWALGERACAVGEVAEAGEAFATDITKVEARVHQLVVAVQDVEARRRRLWRRFRAFRSSSSSTSRSWSPRST